MIQVSKKPAAKFKISENLLATKYPGIWICILNKGKCQKNHENQELYN